MPNRDQLKSRPFLETVTLVIKVMLFSISYAFFNEGIQAIIPERFPSLGDLIMNLAGVLTALFVYRLTHDKIIQEK